jgi:hypothetical protein
MRSLGFLGVVLAMGIAGTAAAGPREDCLSAVAAAVKTMVPPPSYTHRVRAEMRCRRYADRDAALAELVAPGPDRPRADDPADSGQCEEAVYARAAALKARPRRVEAALQHCRAPADRARALAVLDAQ